MPAVQHEIGVVQQRQLRRALGQRFDDRAARIVDQHQDVRQLHRRALADTQPRRNPIHNRALRGADEGGCALMIIILLKVQRHHQSLPGISGNGPCDQHKALLPLPEHALRHVRAHALADRLDPLRLAGLAQIGLGQNQVQRGWRIADDLARLLPVFRLGGILIAGDDRPSVEIGSLGREHHFGYKDSNVVLIAGHDFPPFFV